MLNYAELQGNEEKRTNVIQASSRQIHVHSPFLGPDFVLWVDHRSGHLGIILAVKRVLSGILVFSVDHLQVNVQSL